MQIFFRSKKLQKTCSSAKEVLKAFGAVRGKKLQQRLLDSKPLIILDKFPDSPQPDAMK